MTDNRLTPNKFLNDMEFFELTNNLDRWAKEHPRDALIFKLLLNTGARPSEILALTPNDVLHTERAVFIKGLKGSYSRTIPLPEPLWAALQAYIKITEPAEGEVIFNIAYNTLGQIWRAWRPCKKTLRSTRHTFALRLYKKTKDLRLVQRALGHKSIQNTEIYLDFDYGITELRKAICG